MNFAPASAHVLKKRKKQKLKHALVLICRHRQHFQKAVSVLDEPVPMLGQYEVLFLAPTALRREQIFEQVFPFIRRGRCGAEGRCN
jgi:hypothetical protein